MSSENRLKIIEEFKKENISIKIIKMVAKSNNLYEEEDEDTKEFESGDDSFDSNLEELGLTD